MEQLPENSTEVLAIHGDRPGPWFISLFEDGHFWETDDNGDRYYQLTDISHWLPLPLPPSP